MEPKNLAKDCIEGLLYPWYVHYEEYLGAAEYLAGKMNLIKVFSPFTDEVVESCVEKHDKSYLQGYHKNKPPQQRTAFFLPT